MSGTLNYGSMPKDMPSNNVEPGRHRLVIAETEITKTAEGKEMLVVVNRVVGREKPEIKDRYVVFDAEGNPENFGQYKLNCLLEATGCIPQGDFTLKLVARMLKGFSYYAELIEEEYQGKTYLKCDYPDKFEEDPNPLKTMGAPDSAGEETQDGGTTSSMPDLDDDDDL